jgi:hypothetical protein
MIKYLFIVAILFATDNLYCQGLPSALVDISSTSAGILAPRMTESQRDLITNPAKSLLIYQIDSQEGYYYNEGTSAIPLWVRIQNVSDIYSQLGRTPIDVLPYNITNSGSYIIVADLNSVSSGITINADFVSIDLNGHSLRGSPGNNSPGISVATTCQSLQVYNGFIEGWTNEGINASNAMSSSFSNIDITNNSFDGLKAGDRCNLANITATNNGRDGIDVDSLANINYCIANNNTQDGIECGHGSILSYCNAVDNILVGIKTGNSSNVSQCITNGNDSDGFVCGSGSNISYNTAVSNGANGYRLLSSCNAGNNVARFNDENGFAILGTDCMLQKNNVQGSGQSGFYTSFDRNLFEDNITSLNTDHGFNIQANYCMIFKNKSMDNTISNYNYLANNYVGNIVTPMTLNSNNNPNANFSN